MRQQVDRSRGDGRSIWMPQASSIENRASSIERPAFTSVNHRSCYVDGASKNQWNRGEKVMSNVRRRAVVTALLISALTLPAFAGDTVGLPPPGKTAEGAFPAQKHYSPFAGRNFPTQVFWGDTHLHTGHVYGRGRVRCAAGPRGCLPICPRRGAHVLYRPAGQAPSSLSTSWWWPITPTTWVSSRGSTRVTPRCSPTLPGRKWYEMVQKPAVRRGLRWRWRL